MTTRDQALKRIRDRVRAKLGNTDIAVLLSEGHRAAVKEVIPTGIEVIDRYLLGCGGFPVGRFSEIFGDEGTGKTSLFCATAAGAQREGGLAILCDTEHAFSEERAVTFGMDPEGLILLQPDSLEEAIDAMTEALNAIPSDVGPNLLCLDSLAASPPKAELEGEAGDIAMGVRARLVNKMYRTLLSVMSKKRCHFMVINQIRMKIGVVFGSPETTPGGPSIKYAASHRLRLGSGKPIKDGHDTTGKDVPIKVVKNKVAIPHHEAQIRLRFNEGWDNRWTTISHAKDVELVPQDLKTTDAGYKKALEALNWPVPEQLREAAE